MKDMTLINVIFDKSGSMHTISAEAVGMYNRFLAEQQALPDYAELSLIQFDDQYEEFCTCKPIKDCVPLVDGETYVPRGMTALYDAVGRTINKIGKRLKNLPEEERPARVLCIIITDGRENNSREYTDKVVKEMIEHQKTKFSWDFIFLAAGLNAFQEGRAFGMTADKCATYSKSAGGLDEANNAMGSYATAFRSTGDTSAAVDNHDEEV